MGKIVMDIDIENIKDGDLLVYNARKDKFVAMNKNLFLDNTSGKIEKLKERNNELFEYITEVDNKLTQLIKIYKENLR